MKIMKAISIITFGVIAITLGNCKKETNPCGMAKAGENYSLSDSSKTLIKNYVDANKVVFITLAGEEVSFDVTYKDTIGTYQVGFPCETDTTKDQTIKGTSQTLSFELKNDMIFTEPIKIGLFEFPELPTRQAREYLLVSLGEPFSNSFNTGDELFYYNVNTNNYHLNRHDSLVIGGEKFYSVYEMSNTTQNIEVKYTIDQGIIYLKNSANSIEYIYARKE